MKGCVGWDDVTCSSSTVSKLRRANKFGFLSLLKLADTFVPAADDLANANLELEWHPARDGAVEDAAIRELSSVMDLNDCASGDDFTDALV